MTYDETRKILSILRTAYPQSFLRWSKDQGEAFLSLWSKALQDDDALDVMVAVWHYIYETDREFAPTVGMIRSYIGTTPHYVLEDMAVKFFPEDLRVQALQAPQHMTIEQRQQIKKMLSGGADNEQRA
ncbi:replicative helicase loader/inhibitor [Galactobacillus timonensis]|uniref:replicative helicase loader/inhibitor n=1 Tax=Galactobacillus timonensis TaxID=2041840 RepID=UPI00240A684E|nr:replicative helicase loader/inhibitor [Galactobacillus timonensis]MDD6369153.1 replicative helicase loader/inhibitor [Galactobacillus timonensis]